MRLVLELGTSWGWTRPANGIVRAERKFAEHLLSRTDLDVAFCRYDAAHRRHVPIDRERVKGILVEERHPATEIEAQPADAVPPSKGSRIKSLVRAVGRRPAHALIDRLPVPLRADAWNTLQAGRQFAGGSVRLLRDWAWSIGPASGAARNGISAKEIPSSPHEPFPFTHKDLYVSIGFDWDQNDLAYLGEEKCRVGFKALLFCHDTIPIRFPHLTVSNTAIIFATHLRNVASVADCVAAVSETSRRDFLAFVEDAHVPKPPVEVVLLGTDVAGEADSPQPPSPDLEQAQFILYVSTIEARKNHEILYHTWERLGAKHGDRTPLLVLVGMVGWGTGDLLTRIRTNPAVKDRIRIFDNLGDAKLAWLYRNCLFTVFPSLYEGWGLPVVESLALGKPCICSTAPAVVEASQGMATALDPLDLPAWVAAVERLWLDPEARDLATRRLREFHAQTWREYGESLVAIARKMGV